MSRDFHLRWHWLASDLAHSQVVIPQDDISTSTDCMGDARRSSTGVIAMNSVNADNSTKHLRDVCRGTG